LSSPLDRLRAAWYGSRLYGASLHARPPKAFRQAVDLGHPGDGALADAIFQGRFAFAGETPGPGQKPWEGEMSDAASAEAHAFDWLRHVAAAGGATAQRYARELVAAWIKDHGGYRPIAWRPDVLAGRIVVWLGHAKFLAGDEAADAEFKTRILASLGAQASHLARVAAAAPDGAPRLRSALALALSGAVLEGGDRRIEQGLALLEREIARQVLADGGHVERSPSLQLAILRELSLLRRALIEVGREVPVALAHAIDRMAPMLRLFRLGDGALGVFNGGNAESREAVDLALARADARGKPLDEAPLAGFQRLALGRTIVVLDAGAPPAGAFGRVAHAGALAFEMSVGRDRLVVNCGMARGAGPEWRRALRGTAAHSTLAIGETESSEIGEPEGFGKRRASVVVARRTGEGAIWIDASHDGWADVNGARHVRRLYLGPEGGDFRGEDRIEAATGRKLDRAKGAGFAIRFHLHPGVRAALLGDGAQALLRLPSGGGWSFHATGAARLALEESVYFGEGGERRRAEQLVLAGEIGETGADVQWRFASLDEG
jgi:uncharacterized heparinase superfamily protein